jgi:phosphoribosylamine---glycine ligase
LKILVIGSGGREHALCWKIAQSAEVKQIYAAPGNPGMASLGTCISGQDYLAIADTIQPDLTIVGPEAALAAGIVDQFRARGFAIVGPTAAAARLESSKAFAKALMQRAGIPTARFETVETTIQALEAVRRMGTPVVLKADGLAAGKGVIVAQSLTEAERAIPQLLQAGSQLVIEEFLTGEEVSFIVLSDGERVAVLDPTQDHKTVFDGDRGPNTGGMGAYCDGRILSTAQQRQILEQVIFPAIHTMRSEGCPFTGFLYAGLMMTADGPRVLEFNARLGDPETQVIMHRMASDFVPLLASAARGKLEDAALSWNHEPSVCVVLAAEGYPGNVRSGDAITGIEQATVFQAGTQKIGPNLVTAGGRVLGVTASGPDLASAIANAYQGVSKIHFAGMHYRRDIGQKGLKRW